MFSVDEEFDYYDLVEESLKQFKLNFEHPAGSKLYMKFLQNGQKIEFIGKKSSFKRKFEKIQEFFREKFWNLLNNVYPYFLRAQLKQELY